MNIYQLNKQGAEIPYMSLEDMQVYKDILFTLLITKKEFSSIDNINDFANLAQTNFTKIIDFDNS